LEPRRRPRIPGRRSHVWRARWPPSFSLDCAGASSRREVGESSIALPWLMPWRPVTTASQREIDAFVRDFQEKAVFYLDEPVGPAVAETLTAMGYKVRTAADCGMAGREDADHAALCWREGMILVAHDHDFLNDRLVPEHRNPGVVVLDGDPAAAGRMTTGPGRGDHRQMLLMSASLSAASRRWPASSCSSPPTSRPTSRERPSSPHVGFAPHGSEPQSMISAADALVAAQGRCRPRCR